MCKNTTKIDWKQLGIDFLMGLFWFLLGLAVVLL